MDNIIFKFEADTSDFKKELEELEAKKQGLIQRMHELEKAAFDYAKQQQKAVGADKHSTEEVRKNVEKQKKDIEELGKEIDETTRSIEDLHKQLGDVTPIVLSGAATKKLSKELSDMRNEMSELELAGQMGSARWQELSEASAALSNQLGNTSAQIRALASDTQGLDAALGVGQGLTGVFAAAQSGMALLGGESEELQQAFFKVQVALQMLNGVQAFANAINKDSVGNVVLRNALSKVFAKTKAEEAAAIGVSTTATGVNTAATGGATAATWAWNTALLANPVFWIVAAIMAAVGAIAIFSARTNKQAKEQQQLNEIEKLHLEQLERRSGAIKETSKLREAQLERELSLLESLGASEAEKDKKREEIMQNRLNTAKELEFAHQKEIDSIDENKAKLAELEAAMNAINFAKARGDKKVKIEVDGEVKEIKVKNKEAQEALQGQIDNLKTSVSVAVDISEGLKDAKKEEDVFRNEQSKKERERAIRDAAIIAQVRLDAAEKGSEKELEARINLIEKERQAALSAADLSGAERLKINLDANRKIADARQEYAKRQLMDEKTGIEAQLALTKAGSTEEFELRKKLLLQQYRIEIENVHLTNNEREKLDNEYAQNLQKMNDDFNSQASLDALNTQAATLKAQLASVEEGCAAELKLRQQLAANQAAIERSNIINSVMNESLKAAMILEIDKKLKAQLEQNQKDYDAKVIDNNLKNMQITLDAERIKNEKILVSGNFMEKMKAREEVAQHERKMLDAEEAALKEKLAKGIGDVEAHNQRLGELANERAKQELTELEDTEAQKKQVRQAAFDFAVGLMNSLYEAQKERLQQQLSDLKEYYTTDAEEARNNANKQLLTKEEMSRRELALKRKQAQVEKEQAIFTATLEYGKGVVSALASGAQGGLAAPGLMAAFVAILTAGYAVQMAAIANKPLPKYWKGRKGGVGEYSWVGEHGPEVMWVPDGASIVPSHKSRSLTPEVMREFNIRIPELPVMPRLSVSEKELRGDVGTWRTCGTMGATIDYDRLGRAVAENVKIPEVSQLNVSFDEEGYTKYVASSSGKTKVLNVRFSMN